MYNDPISVNAYRRFIHKIVDLLNNESVEKSSENVENSLENAEFGHHNPVNNADHESHAESEEESFGHVMSTNFEESEIEDLINFEKILAKISSRDDSVAGTFIRFKKTFNISLIIYG